MQGKWNRLSLRTLSSLCHHRNHFTLVMFAALISIVVGSTVRRRFQHRFSAFQQRNLHIDGKNSTILHVFVFHSHFLQYHVRIFFSSRSGVIWRCYASICLCLGICVSMGLYNIYSFNKSLFSYMLYWLNAISWNAQHIVDFHCSCFGMLSIPLDQLTASSAFCTIFWGGKTLYTRTLVFNFAQFVPIICALYPIQLCCIFHRFNELIFLYTFLLDPNWPQFVHSLCPSVA